MTWESDYLTLSDARLYYQSSSALKGDNPTLIFLHYFGGSSRTWLPVMDELTSDYPCVALDLRGSGNSRVLDSLAHSSVAHSLDAVAGDVAALVGHLGCRRYVLIGHSMGGKVALALATRHGCPPGLAALALVAPSPPTPEPMPAAERTRLLAAQGSADAARETLSKITAHPLSANDTQLAVEDQLRVTPAAWRAWLEYGNRQDISARLSRLKVPVTLLAGSEDANITPGLLRREITARLPRALSHEPETVPHAAHLLPLEAPRAVADFIRRAAA